MSDNKKILIVDDDIDILEQTSMSMEAEGYEVTTAESQAEAEDLILSMKPDLAILDLMMEQMDSGLVLAHEIKKMYPSTPVILLTAVKSATGLDFTTSNEKERSWIKADVLLDKPVRAEQLGREVSKLLAS